MIRRRALLAAFVLVALAAGTSAATPTPEHVRFTAAGDYAMSTSSTAAVLDALGATDPDAHFALGDLSYATTGEEQAWCDFVKARVGQTFPFELLAGNHESNGQNGNINDFSACLPNQLPGVVGTYGRQYYVDVPKQNPLVRFVMISPDLAFPGGTWRYTAGSARYAWTQDTIDAARAASIPWVVVGMHKTCVSLSVYVCEVGPDLTNLLLSRRVDLVLTGHEHMYQRSKQLAHGDGCPALAVGSYNSGCVADPGDDLVKGAGTVFATIGTGGTTLRDVTAGGPEAGYFAAASGANQLPSYGFGDFDVTRDRLSMRFVPVAGGSFVDAFTITRSNSPPPPNQPPVASFTSTATDLTVAFDGSTSIDPDGWIESWAWSFGDGTTGGGARPPHTYAAPGTYPVTLTVTDGTGATSGYSADVTVTAPLTNVLARDEFDRTLASAWGRADVGGDWTLRGGAASRYSVGGGAGIISTPAGGLLKSDLDAVSSTRSLVSAEFSVDKVVNDTYVSVVGRQIGTDYYVAQLRLAANGSIRLYLLRNTGSSVGASSYLVPGLTVVPGARYKVNLEVKGISPTTISAKVWRASDLEPAAWQRTGSDSYGPLQAPGRVGVFAYLTSTAGSSAPVTVALHQLTVTTAP